MKKVDYSGYDEKNWGSEKYAEISGNFRGFTGTRILTINASAPKNVRKFLRVKEKCEKYGTAGTRINQYFAAVPKNSGIEATNQRERRNSDD